MAQTTPDPSINQCTQFSYLGVPVATGMDDFYENEFRHRPATPTTVARTTTAQGPKRNVALGLVPSRGGAARGNDARTLLPTSTGNLHTLVCRLSPA